MLRTKQTETTFISVQIVLEACDYVRVDAFVQLDLLITALIVQHPMPILPCFYGAIKLSLQHSRVVIWVNNTFS